MTMTGNTATLAMRLIRVRLRRVYTTRTNHGTLKVSLGCCCHHSWHVGCHNLFDDGQTMVVFSPHAPALYGSVIEIFQAAMVANKIFSVA